MVWNESISLGFEKIYTYTSNLDLELSIQDYMKEGYMYHQWDQEHAWDS